MHVLPDYWLDSAKRDLIPGGSALSLRRYLIIHCTSGASGESSINEWRRKADGVCAHFVIGRDGSIIECRPCNRTCGHAGKSLWHDHGHSYGDLNTCSLGIELANAGSDPGALKWARCQPQYFGVRARHKNGGPMLEWEGYALAQLLSCEALSKTLCSRFNLDDLIGHDDVAPARRDDPGPAFPMAALRQACGFPPIIA